MDPFFAKNRLSAYIDGVLPEREASEVAEAIERDAELQAEYTALRAAVSALRQHGPVSAPEGFKARVMAAVEREPSQTGLVVQLRRVFTRVPVEAAAVAAAALLVVFATATRLQSPPAAPLPEPDRRVAAADVPAPEAEPAPGTPTNADSVRPAAATAPTDTPVASAPPTKEPGAIKERSRIVPQSAGVPTKAGAYVPEWEEQSGSAPTAFGGTEGMALAVSDPDVLRKLHMLTEQSGGRMMDEANQALRPYNLSESDPIARVMLLVPVA
jgi:negative regulator of sigma E activity